MVRIFSATMLQLFLVFICALISAFITFEVKAQDSCASLFQQYQVELSDEVTEGLYKLAEDQVRTQKLSMSESKNMIFREIKRQVFEKASEFESPEVVFSFYRRVIAELSSKDKQKSSSQEINEENRQNKERRKLLEEQERRAIFPHRQMKTVRVEKGRFNRPRDDNKIEPAEIREDFEVVNTHVTQAQYELLMKTNPSFHTNEDGTTKYDHPVERVSRIDAQEYVDKLNELSRRDDPLIYILIEDHRKNSMYDLLTSIQWEYVAIRLRTEDGDTIDNMINTNPIKLREYAVFEGDRETKEVGTRKALYLDGDLTKPIFDWHGNVWSWMKDRNDRRYEVRGGCWSIIAQFLRPAFRGSFSADNHYGVIGFRLLRTFP